MRLIHPTKFKMHMETLYQNTIYAFGPYSGGIMVPDVKMLEDNPGEPNHSLYGWVRRETNTPY